MGIASLSSTNRRTWKGDAPLRLAGALLGGSLTALALGIGAWLGASWPTLPPLDLSSLAIGVGVMLGLLSGPAAAVAVRPVRFALVVAVRAVVVGVTLSIGIVAVLGRASGQPGFDAMSLLGLLLIGIPVAMVLGLPVAAFVSATATAVLRLATRRPVVGSLVIATIAVGALLGAPALGSSRFVLPVSVDQGGAVRLTVTVENHSAQSLVLGVWTTSGDSTGGWTTGIEACFVTSESSDESAGWFVTLQPDTDDPDAWETIPDPLISAVEAPGARADVGVLVAADGTITVSPQRAPPSAQELTVDLCAEEAS